MIAIGIVAHPAREAMAEKLAQAVDADIVMVDGAGMGCTPNHIATWRATAERGQGWTLILEDDAIPVHGFREQLSLALAAAPDPVASMYLGRRMPPQFQARIGAAVQLAERQSACWIRSVEGLHAVALCMKTDLVEDFLARRHPQLPIDQAVGRWARGRGLQISYSVPSIVQHADPPTLVSHPDGIPRRPGRVAWRLGTRDEWTSDYVQL